MRALWLLPLALLLASAAPASSQEREDEFDGAAFLQRLDMNGDGAVDMAEFRAHRAARFARFDPDDRKQVTKAEFIAAVEQSSAAAHARRLAEIFDRIDRDRDGVLTLGEYLAHGELLFRRLDKNGDGVLTLREPAGHEIRTNR